MRPWRAKGAALILLFFLGTFAGQIQHLLDTVSGKVETGSKITAQLRETVTTINQSADLLRAQIADLQAKLAGGTATPAQVADLQALVGRLKVVAGPSGIPGPPGPAGSGGPPGPPAAAGAGTTTSTTTTAPGGTTSSTRPAPTTSSTRPSPSSSTTTTTCAVGLGRLLKIGC